MSELIFLFARFPKLGGLFGLITSVGFGILGVSSWQSYQRMPETILQLTLDEAVTAVSSGEEIWVEISNVVWDCQNIIHTDMNQGFRTEIVFTDATNSILGKALFSEPNMLTCEEIEGRKAMGVLSLMSEGVFERMPERGFHLKNYEGAKVAVSLCEFCGPGNSYLGIICGAIMVPLGLCLYPLSLSLRKNYKNKGIL